MPHLEKSKTSETIPWEASFKEASGKPLSVSITTHSSHCEAALNGIFSFTQLFILLLHLSIHPYPVAASLPLVQAPPLRTPFLSVHSFHSPQPFVQDSAATTLLPQPKLPSANKALRWQVFWLLFSLARWARITSSSFTAQTNSIIRVWVLSATKSTFCSLETTQFCGSRSQHWAWSTYSTREKTTTLLIWEVRGHWEDGIERVTIGTGANQWMVSAYQYFLI